jgi:hypothetical protein
MTRPELLRALRRMQVETGSLVCLGCGHEHNCSTQGCAILREAAVKLEKMRWTLMAAQSPEENGKYLCVWQGKSIETGMFLNGHFRLYGENKDRLVSHWMPLPELPEVETDE